MMDVICDVRCDCWQVLLGVLMHMLSINMAIFLALIKKAGRLVPQGW